MPAERFAHRRDDTDLAAAIGKRPAFGSLGRIGGSNGPQFEAALQSRQNFMPRHDHFFQPGASGIEGHELDEAENKIVIEGKLRESFDFMIVNVANNNGVDLYRIEAEL